MDGREPVTHYTYDAAGRMIESRPESRWLPSDVEALEALAQYRDEYLCPACGGLRAICQDPMAEFSVGTPLPVRCHITTQLRTAQSDYASKSGARPEGLLWRADVDPQFTSKTLLAVLADADSDGEDQGADTAQQDP